MTRCYTGERENGCQRKQDLEAQNSMDLVLPFFPYYCKSQCDRREKKVDKLLKSSPSSTLNERSISSGGLKKDGRIRERLMRAGRLLII